MTAFGRKCAVAAIAGAMVLSAAVWSGSGLAAPGPRDDLVVGLTLEPPHLDPTAGAAAAIDEVTYANVFEGLTRIGSGGAVVPGLARSWDVSDDGLTYTFHLRERAAFHDGQALTSDAVRFSLDRARGPRSVNAQKAYFAAIAEVAEVDAHTVRVALVRPDPLLLFHLGQGDAAIVAPGTAHGNKTLPIGTGPFRFERWVPGDRLTLVRNPDYDGPAPSLQRIVFRFISDPAAQVASLLAGDIDTFPAFGTYEALPRFRADSRFTVLVGTTEGETILATNNARKPFDDPRVRAALAHAIDRPTLIEGAMFGLARPIGSHFAPHHPAYVDLTGLRPYDPTRARALLREAGYPQGFETTLVLPPPAYARRSGELIAAMLSDVGIRVRIENTEWASWLENVFRNGNFALSVIAHTEPLDIDIYGRPDYYFGYRSERFSAALADLDHAADDAARNAVLGRLQRIVAEDAVNGFLFQLPAVTVQNARLSGMWTDRPVQANDLTAVRWER